ncbi:ataxia telangiectasia mutated family protein [Tanacetum coccineum]
MTGGRPRVRSSVGNTKFFSMEVSLHQGSAISPYLFALILDELSWGIQENIPWSMVFADDIMLVAELANGLNMRLESWRKALEDNSLRILQPKESFRYLGSVIHRSGRINEDVTRRIRTGCVRQRAATGFLCDKRVPSKVEVAELRMLRWTCGKTMLDMIPNGVFRAELEVESIIHKMRERRLRWFGHVKKRPQTASVRRLEALLVDDMRRMGRPKLKWEDTLKQDMKELLLLEDMTSDRNSMFPLGFRAVVACLVPFVLPLGVGPRRLWSFCVCDALAPLLVCFIPACFDYALVFALCLFALRFAFVSAPMWF